MKSVQLKSPSLQRLSLETEKMNICMLTLLTVSALFVIAVMVFQLKKKKAKLLFLFRNQEFEELHLSRLLASLTIVCIYQSDTSDALKVC